jgi:hypothetical protein
MDEINTRDFFLFFFCIYTTGFQATNKEREVIIACGGGLRFYFLENSIIY